MVLKPQFRNSVACARRPPLASLQQHWKMIYKLTIKNTSHTLACLFDRFCILVSDHVARDYPVQMFYQRPHIVLNHVKEVTAVFWAPPFEGPLRVKPEDVEPYYRAYKTLQHLIEEDETMREKHFCKFRLEEGDLVVFNNRRLVQQEAINY